MSDYKRIAAEEYAAAAAKRERPSPLYQRRIHPEDPNSKEFQGTPAEIYNLYKSQGLDHENSVGAMKRFMLEMNRTMPDTAKQWSFPDVNSDQEVEQFQAQTPMS